MKDGNQKNMSNFCVGDIVSRNGDDLHIVIETDVDAEGWGVIELMCLFDLHENYEPGERWTILSDRPQLKIRREMLVAILDLSEEYGKNKGDMG